MGEGGRIFFCTFFSVFGLVYLYTTCILLCTFCAFINTNLLLIKKGPCLNAQDLQKCYFYFFICTKISIKEPTSIGSCISCLHSHHANQALYPSKKTQITLKGEKLKEHCLESSTCNTVILTFIDQINRTIGFKYSFSTAYI